MLLLGFGAADMFYRFSPGPAVGMHTGISREKVPGDVSVEPPEASLTAILQQAFCLQIPGVVIVEPEGVVLVILQIDVVKTQAGIERLYRIKILGDIRPCLGVRTGHEVAFAVKGRPVSHTAADLHDAGPLCL